MNNYALPPGEVTLDGDLIGMGEHTDYGLVTVLWADQIAGLQVLGQDGAWHDVCPADGALLVNLGDLTARWTNERWRSTLHRVKPPVVDGRSCAAARRRSSTTATSTPLSTRSPAASTTTTRDAIRAVTVGQHVARQAGRFARPQAQRAGHRTGGRSGAGLQLLTRRTTNATVL